MPAKKYETINVAAFARMLGVSPQAVGKYIDTKKIKDASIQMSAKGTPLIIVEKALADLEKNLNPAKTRRTRTGLAHGTVLDPDRDTDTPRKHSLDVAQVVAKAKVKDNGQIEADGVDMSQDPTTFHIAKIQEQIAKAIKEKLGVAKLRGELVDKVQQDLQLMQFAVDLKRDLSSFSDRVAEFCAATDDSFVIRKHLDDEMESLLEKHANRLWT